jgi:RNA methyltransferase, TrmH family
MTPASFTVPRPPNPNRPRNRPEHARDLLRICGPAAVEALFVRDPGRVERLFFEPRLARALARCCKILAQTHKPFREVDTAELAHIAGTPLHGGVVAVARRPPLAAVDPAAARDWVRDGKPLLILDGIGNPHNLGAIARSAAFFGLARLVFAERPEQALPSDASYRVAEGGLDRLALYHAPLAAVLPALRPFYRIVGAVAEGGRPPTCAGARPPALVLGNEESGLDPATLALCDDTVTITGSGRVQSLNVAAAAAILLYALTRSGAP